MKTTDLCVMKATYLFDEGCTPVCDEGCRLVFDEECRVVFCVDSLHPVAVLQVFVVTVLKRQTKKDGDEDEEEDRHFPFVLFYYLV